MKSSMLVNNGRRNKGSVRNRRFFTSKDIAVLKHDMAVQNSRINRGEIVPPNQNFFVAACGCGGTGCFILGNFQSR